MLILYQSVTQWTNALSVTCVFRVRIAGNVTFFFTFSIMNIDFDEKVPISYDATKEYSSWLHERV